MEKVKNTIPVYNICSLDSDRGAIGFIAERFASYLEIHPDLHLPHRHSFYHLILFTKGSGYHTIDFERFVVAPGHIYFMIPGQVHSWNFEDAPDGFVINFPDGFFRSFLSNDQYLEQFTFFRGVAGESTDLLKKSAYNDALVLFEKIIAEIAGMDAASMDMVRACLIELFITVSRNSPPGGRQMPRQQPPLLFHFRKLVDLHFAVKRLPKEYAALLYITPNHLNAICKDLLGKTAGEVIRDRVLLEAKRLLVNASHSVSAVAMQLNFTDNAHFTKFFKKCTHTTPETFRKSVGVSN